MEYTAECSYFVAVNFPFQICINIHLTDYNMEIKIELMQKVKTIFFYFYHSRQEHLFGYGTKLFLTLLLSPEIFQV